MDCPGSAGRRITSKITNMKTMKHTLYAAIMTLSLAGCSEIEPNVNPLPDIPASIQVSVVTTDGIDTKGVITGNSLNEGDRIGLTLCDKSETLYHGTEYENICYTATGDGSEQLWEGETSIMVSNVQGTLYGYYPYSSDVQDIREVPVSVESQTDYLYATPATNLTKSNNQARLAMKHALAALRLSVSRGTYGGEGIISAASVRGEGIPSSALLNARTGVLSGFKDHDKVIATSVSDMALNGDNCYVDILVIPDGDSSKDVEISLTIDGKEYTATLSQIPVKQGMMSECSIIVNNGLVSLSDVNVIAWSQTTAGSQIVQNDFKVSFAGNTEGLAFSNSIDEDGGLTIKAVPYISEDAETKPVTIVGNATLTQSVDDQTGILTVRLSDIASDVTISFNGYYLWMTATHNVTNISTPTKIYNYGTVERIKMDGVEISIDKNYQFQSTGEHVMKLAFKTNETIPTNLFYTINTITSAVIPEGFKYIGNWAFSGCTKLKSISLPSTLKSINFQCFSRAIIESIYIPDGCSLGYGLFTDCASLKSVRLPADLTEIPESTFSGCSALSHVDIPEGITRIGESAFRYSGITSLHLPETLKEIPYELCNYCQKLEEVTLPAKFTMIGDRAFNYCSSLKRTILSDGTVYEGEFHIPEGVVSLRQLAVMVQSEYIKTIHVPSSLTDVQNGGLSSAMVERYVMTSANPKYDIRNNSVVETATNTLIAGGTESTLIHESVTSIGHSAFYWSKIKTVDFHEGIESIGERAFYYAYPSTIISRSMTPPAIGKECFWIAQYNGKLKVPAEAANAYISQWMINELGYLGWSTARWGVWPLEDGE